MGQYLEFETWFPTLAMTHLKIHLVFTKVIVLLLKGTSPIFGLMSIIMIKPTFVNMDFRLDTLTIHDFFLL